MDTRVSSLSSPFQEHIYALNKVSRLPFVTPYNPAGKYVVRLFFMVRRRDRRTGEIVLQFRALGERSPLTTAFRLT